MMTQIESIRWGLVTSVASILLGFFLGAMFGAKEDQIKSHLKERGQVALQEVYQGDEEMMNKTVAKSWSYMKRAHMHWGGIGAAGTVLILILGAIGYSDGIKRIGSLALGIGSLAYPTFWLMAALIAPEMGGTALAKESLGWLAIPSAALLMAGTVLVLFGLITKGRA